MKKQVLAYGKKRIGIDELMKMSRYKDYGAFAEEVKSLVDEGVLVPVKVSKTNGRQPALFNRYHICSEKVDYAEERDFARTLHPRLNVSGYLKHPDLVRADRTELGRLSEFLWRYEEDLRVPMSINERSFQIFGREKAIKEEGAVKAMLKFNGLDDDCLGIYRTPEPLFDFVYREREASRVLIVENKDTWFTLRKLAREHGLGGWLDFDVLLYGEGKKITDRTGRLLDYDKWVLGGSNQYFYFGDLDWEGIRIYLDLIGRNASLDIRLCMELYRAMLAKGMKRDLPLMKAGQKPCELEGFLAGFSVEEKGVIASLLETGRYIPQEILAYPWFLAQIEGVESWNDF